MGGWRRTAVELFLMVAIGIALALTAPFGPMEMPPALRLAAWIAFIIAGYLIFRPVAVLGRWLAEETRVPRWLTVPLIALVAALPLTALIAFALGGMQVTGFWFGEQFLSLYWQVAAIGVAIHLLMMFLFPAAPENATGEEAGEEIPAALSADATRSPQPAEPAGAFLARLPPTIGRDLICLEMQDHYVAAHTGSGSALLLMRMADAVAELGPVGMQVHRSWWVAHDAIEELEQDGRRTLLRLRGGRLVPVSRTLAPQVRSALPRRPPPL
jgi:uncharacterized membrane protein